MMGPGVLLLMQVDYLMARLQLALQVLHRLKLTRLVRQLIKTQLAQLLASLQILQLTL